MVFSKLLSRVVLPNLEKDLSRSVGREVAKMDCNLAPQVYGYSPKISSLGGAFGGTVATRQQVVQQKDVLLKRVDIPFTPYQGLFHG